MDCLKTRGRIFDIQRFSVHDGPGVRTIVFFKGCFLRCRWCCNPESQEYEIQQMVRDGRAQTVGYDVTVAEVMEQVEKDRVYYRRSNGGVTLSGGEVLAQPKFAASLLCACKQAGINTAIESTACAPFEVIEELLPYLDLYLLDIKHLNSEKHKQFTTKSNDLILENAKKIAKSTTELIIRVPVVPTFNDTVDEIADIAGFAARLDGVKEIHLLPYHRLGTDKYAGLGRHYEMDDIQPPDDAKMRRLLDAAKRSGLNCKIGG